METASNITNRTEAFPRSFEYMGTENEQVTYRWTISDTGIGMSEEFLKRVYEPFSQEQVDARSVYKGSGLGMTIVKSLVDKMGGTIHIKSREGIGTQFQITIRSISPGSAKRSVNRSCRYVRMCMDYIFFWQKIMS